MANVFIEESVMSNIGNAIRSKTGKKDLILPQNMAKEIEGIKTGEDKELLNALISDTITGKVVINGTRIRRYVLSYTENITEIEALQVTVIDNNALYFSTITKATLTNPDIGGLSFAGSKITTLVLKGSRVANLTGVRVFIETPIEKKTGYIYVPKSLIEQYKVETNWVTYANQFRAIEDYPEVVGEV